VLDGVAKNDGGAKGRYRNRGAAVHWSAPGPPALVAHRCKDAENILRIQVDVGDGNAIAVGVKCHGSWRLE
jgi:hypothetical protein